MSQNLEQPRADASLDERPGPYAALAARARRSSDGALALAAAIGCAYLAALVALHPSWWSFVVAPIAIGAYGLWGIADRELVAGDATRRRLLLAARALAAAIGTLAVLTSVFRILGALIGTVIS
ncbi:MAG TPA: hypothetical protein VF761_13590 [Gemmatimonadaceae bacterium]